MCEIKQGHIDYFDKTLKECNGDKCKAYATIYRELIELSKEIDAKIDVTDDISKDFERYNFLDACVKFGGGLLAHEYMSIRGYKLDRATNIYIGGDCDD